MGRVLQSRKVALLLFENMGDRYAQALKVINSSYEHRTGQDLVPHEPLDGVGILSSIKMNFDLLSGGREEVTEFRTYE